LSSTKNISGKWFGFLMTKGQVNGLRITECKDFIDELNNLEGVNCNLYLQENVIEFKSIFTPFIIEIAKGVGISLITAIIIKFFEKHKDKERVSVNIGTINIINGDNAHIINEKLSEALGSNEV